MEDQIQNSQIVDKCEEEEIEDDEKKESIYYKLKHGLLNDVPLEPNDKAYNFLGDTFYTTFLRDHHDLKDPKVVNFYRLFSITDSLQHDSTITDIMLSNYTDELDYICNLHPKAYITMAFDNDGKDPEEDLEEEGEKVYQVKDKTIMFYPSFPSLDVDGLFHPNLLLIRFHDRLRVIISSAYIHVWDWEELTNWVWMQDFFIKPGQPVAVKRMDEEFRSDLMEFLTVCQFPKDRIKRLFKNVCFENIRVRMVTSIPNAAMHLKRNKYGHFRLRKIIHDLYKYYKVTKRPITNALPVLCQSNAIGYPSLFCIRDIISSCNGGMKVEGDINDLFRIVYPSKKHVLKHADIMKINPVNMRNNRHNIKPPHTISTDCFCQYIPNDRWKYTLPRTHYFLNNPSESDNKIRWIYAGTHNLTQAAWGCFKNISQNRQHFTMNNYECGLVLLPKNYVDFFNGDLSDNSWSEDIEENDYLHDVDLGFKLECKKYDEGDREFYYDDYEELYESESESDNSHEDEADEKSKLESDDSNEDEADEKSKLESETDKPTIETDTNVVYYYYYKYK